MLVKGCFECYLCDITQPQIMKKDEKISGKITELVQKEYENEEMRGKKHCKAASIFSGFLRPDLPKAAFSSIVSAMPAVSTAAGRTISSTVSVAVEGNTPSAFPVCPTDCPVTGAVLFDRTL